MHLNQISWQRPHAVRPPGRRSRRWPWIAATTLTACLAAAYPDAISLGAGSSTSHCSIVNAAPRLATTAAVLFNALPLLVALRNLSRRATGHNVGITA
jgi:hypothetical protein